MNDLISWLRAAVGAREESVRKLLVEARRVQLTLQDPKLLGRYIPGWYWWPDVEALCNVALREVQAHRAILDLHPIIWRDIGWLDDEREEQYAEIPVCAHCVLKHSHFSSRAEVPEGPCATVRALVSTYSDRDGYRAEWSHE